jgi:ribosomal-protein-alanine N-acetyltransferase
MAFLRPIVFDPGPILRAEGIYLRIPTMQDHAAWVALRQESRAFLKPWEPTWPRDDFEKTSFRRRIKRYVADVRADHGYPFFIFEAVEHTLLGGLTLSNVRRGVTQSATLGYWMGERNAGKGAMTRAVVAVLEFAFRSLKLHRIEAACIPSNAASIRLLEKVGFGREGYARSYLCIDGTWQDHLLFALVSDDWPTASVGAKLADARDKSCSNAS